MNCCFIVASWHSFFLNQVIFTLVLVSWVYKNSVYIWLHLLYNFDDFDNFCQSRVNFSLLFLILFECGHIKYMECHFSLELYNLGLCIFVYEVS